MIHMIHVHVNMDKKARQRTVLFFVYSPQCISQLEQLGASGNWAGS